MIANMVKAINLRFDGFSDLRKALDDLDAQREREARRAAEDGQTIEQVLDPETSLEDFLEYGVDDLEGARDMWDIDFTENADSSALSQWKVKFKGNLRRCFCVHTTIAP
jgi:DNA-binding MurR/RpiR family transcriptional regulator